ALPGVPAGGLRRCIVTGLVADLVVAGLPVLLLQLELDRSDDLLRLRARRALEREVRRDEVVGIAVALVLDGGARGRWQRLGRPARRRRLRRAPDRPRAARTRRASSSLKSNRSSSPRMTDWRRVAPARRKYLWSRSVAQPGYGGVSRRSRREGRSGVAVAGPG